MYSYKVHVGGDLSPWKQFFKQSCVSDHQKWYFGSQNTHKIYGDHFQMYVLFFLQIVSTMKNTSFGDQKLSLVIRNAVLI